MKKVMVIALVVLSIVLSGCSSEAEPNEYHDYDPEMEEKFNDENTDLENPDPEVNTPSDQGGTPDTNQEAPALLNRKIIYRASLEMAVLAPDDVYEDILTVVGDYTAYIEEADIRQNYYSFTVRVLSSEFDEFVEEVKSNGDLVSFSKTSEDVTNSYSTFEARKLALETRHTRILELISDATDLNTILLLEEERFEIESDSNEIGNILANYDSLVDYSTVEIIIRKAVEEIVVLDRTQTPYVSVDEVTNNSISLVVNNISDENVTIHIDLLLNGEFVKEYEEDTYADSVVEVTFDELKSNKEYTIKVTALAAEHRISLLETRKIDTSKTYGNKITNTFVTSIELVGDLFEFAGLAISGILPFAVLGTVIFIPTRVIVNKRRAKNNRETTEHTVDEE